MSIVEWTDFTNPNILWNETPPAGLKSPRGVELYKMYFCKPIRASLSTQSDLDRLYRCRPNTWQLFHTFTWTPRNSSNNQEVYCNWFHDFVLRRPRLHILVQTLSQSLCRHSKRSRVSFDREFAEKSGSSGSGTHLFGSSTIGYTWLAISDDPYGGPSIGKSLLDASKIHVKDLKEGVGARFALLGLCAKENLEYNWSPIGLIYNAGKTTEGSDL